MKQWIALLCAAATLLGFAACGKETPEALTPTDGETTAMAASPQGEALRLRVVDGAGTNSFVLAGEDDGDVYTVSADEMTVTVNGKAAQPADLENGMVLTVKPGYELLETWPAQFAGVTVEAERGGKDDYGDLCGLYLTVLEDLWNNDEALNSGISYISVDLNDAPGDLTDGEQAAVAWIFAGRHNAQPLTFGLEALQENGYVNEGELYWKDGVLMKISAPEGSVKQSAKSVTFDAEKWRSGTGAIFFNACTAKRGKGAAWEPYQPGGFAIA